MRTLAWLAASFSGAIFAAVYLLPAGWAAAAAAVFLACAAAAYFLRRRSRAFRLALLIAAGLCAGFAWFSIYTDLVFNRAARLDGTQARFTVTISAFPEKSTYSDRVDAYLENESPLPVRVRLYGDDLAELTPGDVVTVSARCTLADQLRGEHTDVFTAKGVFAFLYAEDAAGIEKDCGFTLRWSPQYLAHAVQEKIREIFPPETRGIFLAILTGEQAEISADPVLISDFRIAGVYHILVVSGMHLSFLTGIFTLLFGRRRRALLAAVPVLVLFSAMAGFGASVTRALIMQLFVIMAEAFGRENDRMTALTVALAFLLVMNPYAAAGAGLQLSFAATLGIHLFSDRIFAGLYVPLKGLRICTVKPVRRFLSAIVSLFSASVGANLLSVPLVALYYGNISLVSPVTNLLTVWAFSASFTLGFAACLLGFLWTQLGIWTAWCASVPALYARFVVQNLAKLPLAAVYTENVYVTVWLVFVYALLLAGARFKNARRIALPLSLAVVSLCVILVANVFCNQTGKLRITALDVGQGQCLLLTAGDAAVMIDCGSSSNSDAGSDAAEYLLAHGINGLELLVFTHCDTDHINGFETLAARVPIGAVVITPKRSCSGDGWSELVAAAQARGIGVLCVEKALEISFEGAELRIMPPVGSGTGANQCLSILCSAGTFDFFVTGDMDQADEAALLNREDLPDIELLAVGHHGSKRTTSELLLQQLRPEAAVISVGYNHYGHPAAETLALLDRYHVTVYRTDRDGTVTFSAG